jgi:U3 small nucleolar RNA-associated protein 25
MKAQEAEYAVLSEYCSFSAVTRARALFFQRRVRLMLYTERAHFYHRYRIRGIQVGL